VDIRIEVHMNKLLPENASFEHLKTQAKALLAALKSKDPAALERISGLPAVEPYRLADAQLTIAREYGFTSWSKLKRHVVGYADRRAAFFAAIKAGDRPRVAEIVSEDPAIVRAKDPTDFGAVPITVAANRNDLPMIDLLLEVGADIDARSDWWAGGFGALDLASEEASAYLIARGATLTPHAAARLGLATELKAMLSTDPSVVHQRGGDGQFPLHFAKTPEIVDLIVDAGADLDARDVDHEGTAAQFHILDEPVLRRLIERGATADVFTAVILDDAELLDRLLNTDPPAISRRSLDSGNPWIPAAPGGHIYTYTIGNVAPHQLASDHRRENADALLWEKSSPGLRLAMAGWRGERELAQSLLAEHPGLLATLRPEDLRMLPDAAWQHRTDCVKLLLELGFDPNIRGGEASTAIDRAAFHGFDDVIQAILPYSPDLTVRNAYGGTPLGACIYGSMHGWRKDGNYPRSVKLLLGAGAAPPDAISGSPEVQAVLREYVR